MIFMPYPLSALHLDKEELEIDKKNMQEDWSLRCWKKSTVFK